jgi:hypothetical protein
MTDPNVKAAYCRLHGDHYWSEEHCEESYIQHFDHYKEMTDFILENWYGWNEVPDHLAGYIDEDAVLRDLWISDYIYEDTDFVTEGYYLFHRC